MSTRLAPPDGEEVMSAARRIFDSGLCCAVESESVGAGWEPRLLLFASAAPQAALAAVEDAVTRSPGARVRVAAYDPASLSRVARPAAVVCSPRRQKGVVTRSHPRAAPRSLPRL